MARGMSFDFLGGELPQAFGGGVEDGDSLVTVIKQTNQLFCYIFGIVEQMCAQAL